MTQRKSRLENRFRWWNAPPCGTPLSSLFLSWQRWIKVCGPLRKPISNFNWSQNNFGKINIPQGLDWAFPSLSHYGSCSAVIYTGYSSVQASHTRLASCQYARLEYWIFVYLPENFFNDYFFTALVDFGVPFSINFLSSSKFWGFRKALEQDAMSKMVSVVRRL